MTYTTNALPENPILTDQQIQDLLQIPKRIAEKTPATGYTEENNQRRCDLELEALPDNGGKFSVFIRQNSKFIENFSIGLRYQTNTKTLGTITLVRYNGPHGESSRHPDGHYARPHNHRLTAQEIASGSVQPQEHHREFTSRYSSLEQALRTFFEDIGVVGYAEHFPEAIQPSFFDEHQ
ncbi:MAG: hypothetical protein OXO48_00150 [Caldilineaceae bacterium]|nr:hypothetical protein [Caldilineaceae bacterium]